MKRLLIYTVLIKTLLLGLSGISFACEGNNTPKNQYKSYFPMILKPIHHLEKIEEYCRSLCVNSGQYCWSSCEEFEEHILGDDYVKINGHYQSVKQLKIDLMKSLQGDEIGNRAEIVETVSKKFIDKEILDNLKKIDQLDLMSFIYANDKYNVMVTFEPEETYEVAKILIFVGKLDGENLENKVTKFIRDEESFEEEISDFYRENEC